MADQGADSNSTQVAGAVFRPWCVPTAEESRWWAYAAMAVVVAGQWWVSNTLRLQFVPVWLLPGVAALLLIISVGIYLPTKINPTRTLRYLALSLVTVVVIANAASLVLLVRDVFFGSALGPVDLLLVGLVLWLVNMTNFSILYWELDSGGPAARADGFEGYPDFLFMQQQQRGWAADDWKPRFADYVYVSLTCAIAFSPTDTMPLSRPAKLAMGAESVLSFAILAVLVARAVNIARG